MNKQTESLPVVEGDFKEWPDFWFQQLLRLASEGDFKGAAKAQAELARLGWKVERIQGAA